MPVFPDAAHGAPRFDRSCGMLSPSARTCDLAARSTIRASRGLTRLRLVDPDVKPLEAFDLDDGSWARIAAQRHDESARLRPVVGRMAGCDK